MVVCYIWQTETAIVVIPRFNMSLLGFMSNDLPGFLASQLGFIPPPAVVVMGLAVIAFTISLFAFRSSPKIFLIDFACYKPPNSLACTMEMVTEKLRMYGKFSEESLEFMRKVMKTSGIGEGTYLPEGLVREPAPDMSAKAARKEAEMVVFGAVDELLGKTGVKSEEIGIVVVHSSIFNTVPSLASMVVNRYKLGENVLSYNLSGMGCSAGLLSIALAKDLLNVSSFYFWCYIMVFFLKDKFIHWSKFLSMVAKWNGSNPIMYYVILRWVFPN